MVSTSSRSSEGLGSRLLHVYTTHESSGRMRTALWAPVDIAPYTAGGRRLGAEKRQVRAPSQLGGGREIVIFTEKSQSLNSFNGVIVIFKKSDRVISGRMNSL